MLKLERRVFAKLRLVRGRIAPNIAFNRPLTGHWHHSKARR